MAQRRLPNNARRAMPPADHIRARARALSRACACDARGFASIARIRAAACTTIRSAVMAGGAQFNSSLGTGSYDTVVFISRGKIDLNFRELDLRVAPAHH
jgi:hypothetical protein